MILWCQQVRLGMCSRSTPMGYTSMAPDLPPAGMCLFIPTAESLPGTQVYSTLNQAVTQVGTTFTVNLAPAAVLAAGTYWIEIQANMTFGTQGEWGWTDRTVLSNNPAAFQNPGGGFGVCMTWMPKLANCIPTAGGPDQVYRINGTIGGGGTPSPTPTASPTPTPTATANQCTTYTTATGTGTITAGTTDTGNHCDDCATAVALPFPVSVYGQTFNSANVASNGSLDLIGNQAPFTHGCQVLPNTLWTMAILPYQDDLRTDNISFTGCNVFPGATCGVFTSVTGTAPNRQFNIEWRAVHFADTTTSANFKWCCMRAKQALTSSMVQLPTAALMKPAGCKQARLVRRPRSPAARLRSPAA